VTEGCHRVQLIPKLYRHATDMLVLAGDAGARSVELIEAFNFFEVCDRRFCDKKCLKASHPRSIMNMKGIAVKKYHLIDGFFLKVSTFMPKKPDKNVRGRKMKVIQLKRQRLALSSSDKRASRMLTDLYI
jgi:hypothetical protein